MGKSCAGVVGGVERPGNVDKGEGCRSEEVERGEYGVGRPQGEGEIAD